jgi:hypothetical protein
MEAWSPLSTPHSCPALLDQLRPRLSHISFQARISTSSLMMHAWCCPLSPIPFLRGMEVVRGLPADAHLPYQLGERSMFCDASAGQGDDSLPCLVCTVRNSAAPKAYIKREGMRKHIAAHILKGHIRVVACGFCGVAGSCTPRLTGNVPACSLTGSAARRAIGASSATAHA